MLTALLQVPAENAHAAKSVAWEFLCELAHEVSTPAKCLPRMPHRCGQGYDFWLSDARPEESARAWACLEMAASSVALCGQRLWVVFFDNVIQDGAPRRIRYSCEGLGLRELVCKATCGYVFPDYR